MNPILFWNWVGLKILGCDICSGTTHRCVCLPLEYIDDPKHYSYNFSKCYDIN
jgi:hypothetical protein